MQNNHFYMSSCMLKFNINIAFNANCLVNNCCQTKSNGNYNII